MMQSISTQMLMTQTVILRYGRTAEVCKLVMLRWQNFLFKFLIDQKY